MGNSTSKLPTTQQFLSAVARYLERAYAGEPPAAVADQFVPAADADLGQWLMGGQVERDPTDAPLVQVRSFAIPLGNRAYRFMKLRLTRAPRQSFYVFSVDAHDAFLHAAAGSVDSAALEDLKNFNRQVAHQIVAAWHAADVLTEHDYMRQMIRRARRRRGGGTRGG